MAYFGCKDLQDFVKALCVPEGHKAVTVTGDGLDGAQGKFLNNREL